MLCVAIAALLAGQIQPLTVRVTPEQFKAAKEPQLAVDGDHRIYAAYGMGDTIYLSVSKDGGASYEPPVKVAEAGKLSLGMRRGPRVTAYNGIVTVSATYGGRGGGQDGDILAWRSADKGKTWTGPSRVNDVEGAAREGLHAMAVGPDGTVACTWLDLRSKGTKLYFSASKDGGKTWSPNKLVYESPDGTICQCCHPSLAFSPKGRLYVMFRNVLKGARDMYLASSDDNGKTFTYPSKLGEGTWMLNACPMDGGALATEPDGSAKTVWRREGTVFECMSGFQDSKVAPGTQPWIAWGDAGFYTVWLSGKSVYLRTPDRITTEISVNGDDPVVAASPDGKTVVMAWSENGVRSFTAANPARR